LCNSFMKVAVRLLLDKYDCWKSIQHATLEDVDSFAGRSAVWPSVIGM
jgi:hypothetical protein